MTPVLGQLLSIDGKQVHVAVQGSGPAVVLLHGASGNLRDMTFDLAGRLDDQFTVVSFDRPGLGYSDALHARGESPAEQANHLAQALDELKISRAVIVGHSYGGAVAMAWALERPDQAAAVVSLAGATMPWPGELGPWYGIASSTVGGALVVPLIANFAPRSAAEGAVQTIFEPQAVPDGYLAYVGPDLTLRSPVLRSNARQVNTLKPHVTEMAQQYSSLRMPVEILHGEEDTIVPAQVHSVPMSKLIPTSNLTLLDNVGHTPHHSAPDATVRAIQRAAQRAGLL